MTESPGGREAVVSDLGFPLSPRTTSGPFLSSLDFTHPASSPLPVLTWPVPSAGCTLLFYESDGSLGIEPASVPKHAVWVENSIVQAVPEHPKKDFVFCLSNSLGDAFLFQVCWMFPLDSEPHPSPLACAPHPALPFVVGPWRKKREERQTTPVDGGPGVTEPRELLCRPRRERAELGNLLCPRAGYRTSLWSR